VAAIFPQFVPTKTLNTLKNRKMRPLIIPPEHDFEKLGDRKTLDQDHLHVIVQKPDTGKRLFHCCLAFALIVLFYNLPTLIPLYCLLRSLTNCCSRFSTGLVAMSYSCSLYALSVLSCLQFSFMLCSRSVTTSTISFVISCALTALLSSSHPTPFSFRFHSFPSTH
jgi:hypothetical protein